MVSEDQARPKSRYGKPWIVGVGKATETAQKVFSVYGAGFSRQFDRENSELNGSPLNRHQPI
ncbi:MAG TPA: hypothetical protein PK648_14985 [Verrucomicrobiales bacterium]|nr:hypothetical protein [Verrucomicrobiales bacterium]